MEQVLTDNQLFSLLDVLEEGEKSFTQASYRDLIMTAQTDTLFELGVRDVATMEAGWKMFGKMQTRFHGELLSIYGKFQAGTLTIPAATAKFQALMKEYGTGAFYAGTQMVGNKYYREVGMTAKDKAFINKYVRAETRYFRRFLGDIKDPRHLPVDKIPRDARGRLKPGYRRQVHPYRQRLGYYANSLRGMGFNGAMAGAGTLLNVYWRLDKLAGRKSDHCEDCVRLAAGNPYSWKSLPTTPRAGDTQCLYRCYCGLEFQDKKGKGREFNIPGSGSTQALTAPGRWGRLFDKTGAPIGGAALHDVESTYQRMFKARQMIEITKGQEKLKWIKIRQQLNASLIQQFPQYRKVPSVAVKDLLNAVHSAKAVNGSLLENYNTVKTGTTATLLRGDYFANGKFIRRRGTLMFKDANGVELIVNAETDISWILNKNFSAVKFKTMEEAKTFINQHIANDIVGLENVTVGYLNKILPTIAQRMDDLGLKRLATIRLEPATGQYMSIGMDSMSVNINIQSMVDERFRFQWENRRFKRDGRNKLGITRLKGGKTPTFKELIRYCTTHEMGHRLWDYATVYSTKTFETRWTLMIQKYDMRKYVSDYGSLEYHGEDLWRGTVESFAEAFAYKADGGIGLPIEVSKLIDEVVNEAMKWMGRLD